MNKKPQRPRGTGSLYRRGNSPVWWIKYYQNGRRFRESTGTENLRVAEKKLQTRLAELNQGNFVEPTKRRVLIDELMEGLFRDYRIQKNATIYDVEARWKHHLKKFFAGKRAADLGSDQISKYIESRLSEGAQNSTINRELAALKRAYRLAFVQTPPLVVRMPAFPSKLTEDNVRQGFLKYPQYQKLVAFCGDRLWLRSLLELGKTYGWRIGEFLGSKKKGSVKPPMKAHQIDLLRRTIRLEPGTTKNKEAREVVMTDAVFGLLSACIDGKKPDDPVFTRFRGGRHQPVRDFRKIWERACAFAGCPDLLFHDLRRTAARGMRDAGVSQGVSMKVAGWKTNSIFLRYNIVDRRDMESAVLKIQENEKQIEAEAKSQEVRAQFGPQEPKIEGTSQKPASGRIQ